MHQTRLQSLCETVVNTAVGYVISLLIALYIYPLFGAKFSFSQTFWITFIFTIASIVRGYAIRRFFNSYVQRLVSLIVRKISE